MLEAEAFAVGGLAERLDGFPKAQGRELHLADVRFPQPQPPGLPQVPHALRPKPQQLGANDVRRHRVGAGAA